MTKPTRRPLLRQGRTDSILISEVMPMADSAKEAIREVVRTVRDIDNASSTRVTRDGDHFSFPLPERPTPAPPPVLRPERKAKR